MAIFDGYLTLKKLSKRKRKNFNCEKTREKAFQVESLNTNVLRQGIHLIYLRRASVGRYRQ